MGRENDLYDEEVFDLTDNPLHDFDREVRSGLGYLDASGNSGG